MKEQRGVVFGHTFGDPQTARDVLVLVVERAEFDRPQPLHVPGVKDFMARQLEPSEIARAGSS
jgi:hypothetical protein